MVHIVPFEHVLDCKTCRLFAQEANETGALDWYWFNDPVIRRLAEEPELMALKASVDEHINAERAKLGWPPAEF